MENKFFTDLDRHYFHQGTHYELYNKMGAHIRQIDGVWGVQFVLWAPNARAVCVVCDSNGWTPWKSVMEKVDDSIWELFIPNLAEGEKYKYLVVRADGSEVQKCDPYAYRTELRPNNASIVVDLEDFEWSDEKWLDEKAEENFLEKPMSVYEVHLGSWKKDESKNDEHRFLDYKTLAHELAEYILYMGYTHIELMGICEYPFDPSWGYQVTGYFSPTARYGSPQDFMYFVDYMHKNGIGVILDWVPAHFPKDDFGLANFDGTPLYEYADPLRAEYPEWGTKAFDLGKKEVSNFLIASAFFWVKKYHVDALRVDAVCSMLYNSFGRQEWRPNKDGGDTNLESFEFFRHLNSVLRQRTNAYLIAEDSSILEGVTKPAAKGGLGFGMKWNMGWMNDTLSYMKKDPVFRKYHHWQITHTFEYIFDENYMLVLSHDEVVYGKGSMYNKFPGNHMDKFGSLKTCYTMMMGHPGKKLLFMGQDFAQKNEWNYATGLDWYLCDDEGHKDVQNCYRSLLHLYKERPVLYNDTTKASFEWINSGDFNRSIFSFIRRNPWNYNNALVFVCNFTPIFRENFAVGVPVLGTYNRIFSTYPDERPYTVEAEERLCDGRPYCVPFNLRPFESMIFEVPFVEETEEEKKDKDKQIESAKQEFTLAKNDLSHIPSDTPPLKEKPSKKVNLKRILKVVKKK
ncbi:MAG: 1,4-alpha-glucan branching protein GlgB [Clostridiales bacterium]|nr:1,4-alpha-glucan branching protein GlgB [Clostridiales bacterium]